MLSRSYPFSKSVTREALASSEAPAVVLYAIVVAAYGDVLYGGERDPAENGDGYVEPIELWLMLKRDFNVTTAVEVENRINAMRTAVETDGFYEDVEAFVAVTKGIVEGDIDDVISGMFEELSIAEIIMAMFEVATVRQNAPAFAPSVAQLIEDEARKEAEADSDGAPTQDLVNRHKDEIKKWFTRLGASAQLLANF